MYKRRDARQIIADMKADKMSVAWPNGSAPFTAGHFVRWCEENLDDEFWFFEAGMAATVFYIRTEISLATLEHYNESAREQQRAA